MTDDFSRARMPLDLVYEVKSGDDNDDNDDSDDDNELSSSVRTRSSFSHSC
jgi:hypothetical protein